jgi:Flp pilus assembly pilin Flp
MEFAPRPRRAGDNKNTSRGNVKRSRDMIRTALGKLVRDENGGEVIEYALIAGLIIVAALAIITSFGGKVLARWTSVNSSM